MRAETTRVFRSSMNCRYSGEVITIETLASFIATSPPAASWPLLVAVNSLSRDPMGIIYHPEKDGSTVLPTKGFARPDKTRTNPGKPGQVRKNADKMRENPDRLAPYQSLYYQNQRSVNTFILRGFRTTASVCWMHRFTLVWVFNRNKIGKRCRLSGNVYGQPGNSTRVGGLVIGCLIPKNGHEHFAGY